MKERPILFTEIMVKAVLLNLKTQTRRTAGLDYINQSPDDWRLETHGALLGRYAATFAHIQTAERFTAFCPYGQAGDRLWGRETWTHHFGTLLYRADFEPDSFEHGAKGWKPSIHMKRRDARLRFDLQQVRIERVQSISEADALAEGMQAPGIPAATTNRAAFARLWSEINGKRGMGWSHNPWTWPLTIQQVTE